MWWSLFPPDVIRAADWALGIEQLPIVTVPEIKSRRSKSFIEWKWSMSERRGIHRTGIAWSPKEERDSDFSPPTLLSHTRHNTRLSASLHTLHSPSLRKRNRALPFRTLPLQAARLVIFFPFLVVCSFVVIFLNPYLHFCGLDFIRLGTGSSSFFPISGLRPDDEVPLEGCPKSAHSFCMLCPLPGTLHF